MLKSFLFWIHGLAAVFIGGVANSVVVTIADPVAFNFHGQWKKTLATVLIMGLFQAAAYLKASPLPTIPTTPATEEKQS